MLTVSLGLLSDSVVTISAIICAHNPDPKRLDRVFQALARQTLPQSEWEVVLVDNASSPELAGDLMAWHPAGRVLREATLGLTHARLTSIAAAKGDILVFVDDDCLLEPDYLVQTLELFQKNPFMGMAGGYGRAEYEIPPPAWMTPSLRQYHLDMSPPQFDQTLIYARVQPHLGPWFPVGAGMAIRRHLAVGYAQSIRNDSVALGFDRAGNTLAGAGDLDMGIHAIRQGFAIGKSRDLRFVHVVPKFRLELDYMLRLIYLSQYSTERLLVYRGWHKPLPLKAPSWWQKAKARIGEVRRHTAEDLCWHAFARGKGDGLSGVAPDPQFYK